MNEAARYVAQAAAYGAFAVFVGYLSAAPAYTHFPPEQAMVKLSFTHGAAHRGECRKLSAEELAKLAPNMRKPLSCPRERLPVFIELLIDDAVVYRNSLPPTGISGDGPSRVYRRFPVAAGSHHITVRMRDTARETGVDYVGETAVSLAPQRNLVIDFRPETGGFFFK